MIKLYCHICGNEIDPSSQDFRFETDAVVITLMINWKDTTTGHHQICETCVRETVGSGKRKLPSKGKVQPSPRDVQLDVEYTFPE